MIDCQTSTQKMAEVLFPEHVYRPFGAAHDPIFSILDDDSIRLGLIVCPRGWGKTTLSALVFPARKALFRDVHYILYISSTASKATQDVQTLAKELQSNNDIKTLFGDLRGLRWAEGTGEIELASDIRIEAKGAGHQIRGLKFGKYRPDLIIIDDLEDPEGVENEKTRAKLKRWLFADVLNSIDLERTRVIMLGTLLHEDSLISNILDEEKWDSLYDSDDVGEADDEVKDASPKDVKMSPRELAERFVSIRIEACNDKLESTWPSFMPTEKIRAKAKAYERRGLLDVFFREFRNLIIPTEGGTFHKGFFKYYDEDYQQLNRRADNIVIVDPAKTTNTKSAYTGIVGVGFEAAKNKIYLRDCVNEKLHPDEIYQAAVDMAIRIGAYNIGLKVTSLNEFITYPFQAFLATKYRHMNIVELKERGDKDMRISALAPFYRMGVVWHNRNVTIHGPLETQLLVHPNGKLKDVADAFADFIQAFDLGDKLFTMQVSTEGLSEEMLEKMEDDEFAILEETDYDDTAELAQMV